jgi:hypothetical protein
MTRTRKPPLQEKSQPAPSAGGFSIHSVTLSAEESAILKRLSQEASDFLGRSISSSAVIRALLRQIEKHGPSAADDLCFEVERELKAGVMWGKQK